MNSYLEYDFSWIALLLSVIGASFMRKFCNKLEGKSVKVGFLEPDLWALKSHSQIAIPQSFRASSWPQQHKYFFIDMLGRRDKYVELDFVKKCIHLTPYRRKGVYI